MKLTDTLKFFIITVALLALLCVVFPADGIRFAGIEFRFPTLHKVLVREKAKDIDSLLAVAPKRDLSQAIDSINDCYQTLFSSQYRFWLPNDDPAYFDNLFSSLCQAQRQHRIVRILHYGDSQIEQDRITLTIRERMQEVFGGGGPGLLPLRQPVPTYSFNQNASGSLFAQTTWGDSAFVRNGHYGPMLRSWHVSGQASLSLSASKGMYATPRVSRFSMLRVLYNNRPGPLSVSMTDRAGSGSFKTSVSEPGIGLIAWQLDTVSSSARITINGNADIYGILVDDGYGVAVDNIGMRSTSGHQFGKVKFNQLAESYKLIDVGMIIMQFGGNSVPYLRTDKAIQDYCSQMAKQIDYLHSTCPDAAILFIGPSDMGSSSTTYKRLHDVINSLRQTANAHNAAFWSIYDAMGGQGSMSAWHDNGLAGSDYIHFTPKGAELMGNLFSDAFLKFYQLYLLRQQYPDQIEKIR